MMEFRVEDMTCNHCVGTITKAVKGADAGASVNVDLQNHLVKVEGASSPEGIANAIRDAGYTPVQTQ